MGLNITQIRSIIRNASGENATQLSDIDCDLYANRELWTVGSQFPFREKEKRIEFNTVTGVALYNLPTQSEAITHLSIVDADGRHHPLDNISVEDYENNYIEGEDAYDFPKAFTREGCAIRLIPTPDDVYKLVMRRNIVLTDLSASNATPSIPQEWHEIIGMGGAWRRLFDLGDLTRAALTKQFVEGLKLQIEPTSSKEEKANRQYAGVMVLGRDYDQRDPR